MKVLLIVDVAVTMAVTALLLALGADVPVSLAFGFVAATFCNVIAIVAWNAR